MRVRMYGLDCVRCGHGVELWVDDRVWPCGCAAGARAIATAGTVRARPAHRGRPAGRRRTDMPAIPA